MGDQSISKAAIGRIPVYIQYLTNLSDEVQNISATTIAKELGLGEVQVRKDLGLFCGKGKPKVGYIKKELLEVLEEYMNTEDGDTIIVGAGKLGTALLEYSGFEDYGLHVIAAFDRFPRMHQASKPIYSFDEMHDYCREHSVRIGIITVPADAAQDIADLMYSCGIRAFLSFAPRRLKIPEDAVIQYEDMGASLSFLKLSIKK